MLFNMEAKDYIDEILKYVDIKNPEDLEKKFKKDTENMSKEEKYKYYRKNQKEIFDAIYRILEESDIV